MKYAFALVTSIALVQASPVPSLACVPGVNGTSTALPCSLPSPMYTQPPVNPNSTVVSSTVVYKNAPKETLVGLAHVGVHRGSSSHPPKVTPGRNDKADNRTKKQPPVAPLVDGTGDEDPWLQPLTVESVCDLFDEMIILVQPFNAPQDSEEQYIKAMGRLDDWGNMLLELQSRIDQTPALNHVAQLEAASCFARVSFYKKTYHMKWLMLIPEKYSRAARKALAKLSHNMRLSQEFGWKCRILNNLEDAFEEHKSVAVKMYGVDTDTGTGQPHLLDGMFDDSLPEWWPTHAGTGTPDPRTPIRDWVRSKDVAWHHETGGFAEAIEEWHVTRQDDGTCPPLSKIDEKKWGL
ncbi:hypothetical protein VHEMI03727 [[Torrubiella] hemipterigena]|uniref:Uncharacterized protein n=1 Tax=[Torrubiella] hemipterigena TaxID=1531966 RepID=A0A0A1TC55_9HYPO|nr:hypothetical protein VHEMI03727 [[Torrubiella] hemipterigena]